MGTDLELTITSHEERGERFEVAEYLIILP